MEFMRPNSLAITLLLLIVAIAVTSAQTPEPVTPVVTPSPTVALLTPTSVTQSQLPPVAEITAADFTPPLGWSCGDFPCADDLEGWLERLRVPDGFAVSHYGQFPGQVRQIVIGSDGRLYGTVLEDGTLTGAIYALDPETGESERYSDTLASPLGLAFQPGTDVLYVTTRLIVEDGGLLLRIDETGASTVVLDDLPCCYLDVGNQPNGLVFGPDGLLYVGVGATSDRAESLNPNRQAFDDVQPDEAAILRIDPHTGETFPHAIGIRNPYDLGFDGRGQLYVTDIGLVTGPGDRLLAVDANANYGWPYYRLRGCPDCPPTRGQLEIAPDLLRFPDYSLPRGIVAYQGGQFPENMQNTLFVTLWNGTDWAQRVLWIDPRDPLIGTEDYQPVPFMTGLLRPSDVIVAPDGSLLVADFIHGHVWQVSYTAVGSSSGSETGFQIPTAESQPPPALFATNTPLPD